MTEPRFTFKRGGWYGLSMYPGYIDTPYHSPIRVEECKPLGNRCFELTFLNLAYAAGVKNLIKPLQTLRRTQSHLVAKETDSNDRTLVFVMLNQGWMKMYFPSVKTDEHRLFDSSGEPNGEAFLRLMQ